jgi:polar amino acid transport system permease protein
MAWRRSYESASEHEVNRIDTRLAAVVVLIAAVAVATFGLSHTEEMQIADRIPAILGVVPRNGFLQGAALTVFVTAASSFLAMLGAALLAWMKSTGQILLAGLSTAIISFGRGTPLLLQLFLFYFALPEMGVVLGPLEAGIASLAFCYSAFASEIMRSSFRAVPAETLDAARALGLSNFARLATVQLPLAARYAVVPLGNMLIALIKDTSLVSVIGVWDLMMVARIYGARDLSYLQMLMAVGIVYWGISAVLELGVHRLEQRLSRYRT